MFDWHFPLTYAMNDLVLETTIARGRTTGMGDDEDDNMSAWSGSQWRTNFACVDLNQLWAAAIPLGIEDNSDEDTTTAIDSTGSSPTFDTIQHDQIVDTEQGEEIIFQPQNRPTPSPPRPDANLKTKVSLPKQQQHSTKKQTLRTSSRLCTTVQYIKYAYSGVLLAFSILMVSAAIFEKQTTATADTNTHPVLAFVVFWCLILWLALMEGGLNAMVGLKPIDKALYASSHPLALKCTTLAHKGDNLERFIVGRQFLDLMCVFLTNFMVSAVDDAAVLGLPSGVLCDTFLGAGLAVILVTIVIGQLVSQINAAHCMLDFINNWVMVATTYAALTLENSGLLHATYLVRILVSKLAGRPIKSSEGDEHSLRRRVWFWTRVLLSTTLLAFAFAVTVAALFDGNTTMWDGVPAPASIFLLVALIGIVGNMEGLQIALFAVVHLDGAELSKHPVAHRNCQLTFRGTNLQAFLVGRQILQTIIMFMIARITTLDIQNEEENVFGVSNGLQQFFNTGLLGALISTIIASLSWRIIASSFPIAFLSNPFGNITIRFCLFIENTGVCAVSWVIAAVHKKLARLQVDEVYVGTAAERSAAAHLHKEDTAGGGDLEGCTSSDSSH